MTEHKDDYEQLVPILDPDGLRKRCVALSYNLVEQRLLNGTASAQETVFFLKMGSREAELEIKRLEQETALLEAKTEASKASKFNDEFTTRVLDALKKYQGYDEEEENV